MISSITMVAGPAVMYQGSHGRKTLASLLALFALAGSSIAFRTAAPSDIFDDDQASPMAHMVDVAVNGNWFLQKNTRGFPNAKPPLFPWVGGIAVHFFGHASEWPFKLPLLIAFAVVGAIIFDLTRREASSATAWLAVVMWVANYHTFKLMFTARTDMLLAMWIAVALWAVQRQRERWKTVSHGSGRAVAADVGWVLLFGVAVGCGFLTKGPAAVLPLPWLLGCVVVDGAWRRCRPLLQFLGLVVMIGLSLAWLLPAVRFDPYWCENMRVEWVDRVTGTGSGAHRSTTPLAVPGYFLARFAPWSLVFVVAAIGIRRWTSHAGTRLIWPAFWVVMLVGLYMIPSGKRADYILPAYVAASIMAAQFVERATTGSGWPRVVVHIVLGGTALGSLLFAFAAPWTAHAGIVPLESPWLATLSRPAPLGIMVVGMTVATAAGIVAFVGTIRRRYHLATWACGFAVVGMLGIYQSTMSRAGRMRSGDAIIAIADRARETAAATSLPVLCREIETAEVRALLGLNRRGDPSPKDVPRRPTLIVTTRRDWDRLVTEHPGDHAVVATTSRLKHEPVRLVVGQFEPAPR